MRKGGVCGVLGTGSGRPGWGVPSGRGFSLHCAHDCVCVCSYRGRKGVILKRGILSDPYRVLSSASWPPLNVGHVKVLSHSDCLIITQVTNTSFGI